MIGDAKSVKVTLRLPEDIHGKVKTKARQNGLGDAEGMRQAIENWLNATFHPRFVPSPFLRRLEGKGF
jgi:hypothetical protein